MYRSLFLPHRVDFPLVYEFLEMLVTGQTARVVEVEIERYPLHGHIDLPSVNSDFLHLDNAEISSRYLQFLYYNLVYLPTFFDRILYPRSH